MGVIVIKVSESFRYKEMELAEGVTKRFARQLKGLGYGVDIHNETSQPDDTITPAKPKRGRNKNVTATCDDC